MSAPKKTPKKATKKTPTPYTTPSLTNQRAIVEAAIASAKVYGGGDASTIVGEHLLRMLYPDEIWEPEGGLISQGDYHRNGSWVVHRLSSGAKEIIEFSTPWLLTSRLEAIEDHQAEAAATRAALQYLETIDTNVAGVRTQEIYERLCRRYQIPVIWGSD